MMLGDRVRLSPQAPKAAVQATADAVYRGRRGREIDHRISSAMTMIMQSASNISIVTVIVSNIWPLPRISKDKTVCPRLEARLNQDDLSTPGGEALRRDMGVCGRGACYRAEPTLLT
jgi:hypothetical protein